MGTDQLGRDMLSRIIYGTRLSLVAGGIVVIYVIWQFLLDYRIFVDNFPVIVSVLTVLAIWVHRWGHYDFGKGYRILVGALGVVLALFAWHLASDRATPYTQFGKVDGYVVPIASQVSGYVSRVEVVLNEIVQEGDTLIEINPLVITDSWVPCLWFRRLRLIS